MPALSPLSLLVQTGPGPRFLHIKQPGELERTSGPAFEEVETVVCGDKVKFQFKNGRTESVPHALVARTAVLQGLLDGATPGLAMKLSFPTGYLQQWLRFVGEGSDTLQLLKVADFMGDDNSVELLSRHAAAWLFEGHPDLLDHRAQAVARLPSNLITQILTSADMKAKELLARCPRSLSAPAVHLLFPELSQKGCLQFDCDSCISVMLSGHLLWPHLHHVPELKDLDLSGQGLGQECDKLLKHLAVFTSLTCLSLNDCSLDGQMISRVVPKLADLPNLRSLDLGDNAMGDEGMNALASGLSNLKCLHTLHFTFFRARSEASPEAILQFFSYLHLARYLDDLAITGLEIDACMMVSVCEHLPKFAKLFSLTLGCHPYGVEGLRELSHCLPNLPLLHCLDLSGLVHTAPEVNDRHNVEILGDLGSQLALCTSLQMLNISNSNLGNDGLPEMLSHLGALTSLSIISLLGNSSTDRGIIAAVPYFEKLTNLQLISVAGVDITVDSAMALKPLLNKLPHLRAIAVSDEVLSEMQSCRMANGRAGFCSVDGPWSVGVRSVDDDEDYCLLC